MNTEEKEGLLNEKINPQVEEIADLPVTDEQARQAKGGRFSSDADFTNGHGTHVAGTIGSQ